MHGIARIKLSLLTIVLFFAVAGSGAAQPADEGLDYTIHNDEVRLEGTVRALDRITGQFVLNVDVTVSRGDESGDIAAPGAHRIQVKHDTSIVDRSTGVQGLQFDNIGVGVEAIVIGRSKGNGQFVEARLVAVSRGVLAPNLPIRPASRRQRLMGDQGVPPWTLPPAPVQRPRSVKHASRRTNKPRLRPTPRVAERQGAVVGRAQPAATPRPAPAAVTKPAPSGSGPRTTTATTRSAAPEVGSSRVDLQACKLEYSIVSPK